MVLLENNKMNDSQPSSREEHVVVIPYPSQGHINPLLQFAKRLASLGVKTTFVANTSSTTTGLPASVSVEPLSGSLGSSSPAVGEESDFLASLRSNGSDSLTRIIEKHAHTDSPVRCVVYDAFFPWALHVARAHGVKGAAFFTNSATVSVFFSMVHRGRLAVPLEVEAARRAVPGVTWEARDLPSFLRRPESYPAYLEMKLSQFGNLELADWVFCNSFDDLESEVLKGIVPEQWPAKLIGPMVPSAYLDNTIEGDKGYGASLWKPVSHQYIPWLDSKPPKSVVYVSFGSLATLTLKQTSEIASALEDHGSPFLWIVRESQLDTLPSGFLEESARGQKGLVATWCDQLEVLSHPSVGSFVTHCGWNSTLEGICLGIPMVGIPQWTDQLTDAKFFSDVWRIGVRVREDEAGMVGKAELRARLDEVMVDGKAREEIGRNGAKWKELAKKAVSKEGSSAKNIDEFVKGL